MKIFYQNLKLTQLYRKFKITESNGYNVFGEWTENTATIMKSQPCGKRRQDPLETSGLLMGPEQVWRPKTLQAR